MSTRTSTEPVRAHAEERECLEVLDRILQREHTASATISTGGGEEVNLPDSVLRVLRQVVQLLSHDETVMVASASKLLTTSEAADFLSVSRPYVMRLLERGEIPFVMVGSHHRVAMPELLSYKEARDAQRRAALRRLTEMSQELGLCGTR